MLLCLRGPYKTQEFSINDKLRVTSVYKILHLNHSEKIHSKTIAECISRCVGRNIYIYIYIVGPPLSEHLCVSSIIQISEFTQINKAHSFLVQYTLIEHTPADLIEHAVTPIVQIIEVLLKRNLGTNN